MPLTAPLPLRWRGGHFVPLTPTLNTDRAGDAEGEPRGARPTESNRAGARRFPKPAERAERVERVKGIEPS